MDSPIKSDKKRKKGLSLRQKALLEALGKTLGIVTGACMKVGVNPDTHYEWLKKSPEYRAEYEKLENKKLDVIETAFLNLVDEKNPQAVIHAVKTKLKHRGYGEDIKQTIETKGEGFKLVIEVPDERDQMETK